MAQGPRTRTKSKAIRLLLRQPPGTDGSPRPGLGVVKWETQITPEWRIAAEESKERKHVLGTHPILHPLRQQSDRSGSMACGKRYYCPSQGRILLWRPDSGPDVRIVAIFPTAPRNRLNFAIDIFIQQKIAYSYNLCNHIETLR